MVRTDRKYRIGHQQGKADKKVEKTVEIGFDRENESGLERFVR
jgi:hypothetical protein